MPRCKLLKTEKQDLVDAEFSGRGVGLGAKAGGVNLLVEKTI